MKNFDVIIVGLGPAGASAARAVAGGGASVLALERKSVAGTPVQCAELIPQLIASEAGDVHRSLRQRVDEMLTFVEDGEGDRTPNFPGQMIDRADFDAKLVEDAVAAGATCQFNTMVRAIDDRGVLVTSIKTRLKSRLIIAADGPRSLVSRAAGLNNTEFAETRQITVKLCGSYAATDIFLSADITGGYGWLFPKKDTANLGVGVSAHCKDRLKPLLNTLHDRLISEGRVTRGVLKVTGGAIPVGGIRGPIGYLGATPVLLAGDAAGLTNPITGAGINAAVISGALAGEAALKFLDGDTFALDDYRDGIEDLFKPAIDRALTRRKRLQSLYAAGVRPCPNDLRESWIAYDAYWRL
jgi:geranylgeranyl reductase family protein